MKSYVATPLVNLQEGQVAALADQRVQAEVAALEERGQKMMMSPAAISRAQSDMSEVIKNSFREAVTASLKYLLMILGSFAFGWLSCWAYGHRHSGGMPAAAQGKGETP